ncbi:N-acetyltransferase [Lysinibacillus sp. 2017]|uniref:GNAT family N-acetyltransferase n=1 Tax=unclassified Lysinibacillus TaxID=2636778 RepID=UPI000D527520|nr:MULTISPECIES: GNAT family N-acetyltransferase [unclassified Lysinibacillus]AWE07266.1 N-acetyltransferase [Lysinibacillus sp. 2017]TGN33323.1 N-acetyltransferase [Lysinibacillus sp. S2017]
MLGTKRLKLVDYTEADLPFLENMLRNPNVMRFISDGQVRNKEQAVQFLNRIMGHYHTHADYGLKLLLDKETGAKIGHAGLVPQTIDCEEFIEVGYWIDEPFWGNGYASEVAIALLQHGLQTLHLPKVISLIQHGNIASEKIAIKNGMKKVRDLMLSGKSVHLYTSR